MFKLKGYFFNLIGALFLLSPLLYINNVQAQYGGGGGGTGGDFAFGIIGGSTGAEQKDLNTLRARANNRDGGISAGELNDAWEIGAFIQWRFSYAGFQLRPSYFFAKEDGSGDSGNYEYSVTGYTVSGIFKLYPLENNEIKLFFQTGVAWGQLETEITEASFNATATGSNLGYLIGAGIELGLGSHLIILEVGWRYLLIERNITDSTSGTAAADSVSQSTVGQELEYDNQDLMTSMSGIQTFIGYGFRF